MILSDLGSGHRILSVWLAAFLLALSLVHRRAGRADRVVSGHHAPAGNADPRRAAARRGKRQYLCQQRRSGITGSYRHFRDGRVKLLLVVIIGVPAFAAGFLGGYFSNQAPTNLLIALAGGLILWQGVELGPVGVQPAATRCPLGTSRETINLEGSAGTIHDCANRQWSRREFWDRIAGRRHRPGAGFRQAPAHYQGTAG